MTSVRWRTDALDKMRNTSWLACDDRGDEETVKLGSRFLLLLLATSGLTAFLVHIGAAEPLRGGIAIPTTAWLAWVVVGIARATRHRARLRRDGKENARQLPRPLPWGR
jgi:hypothetical protein